MNSVAEWEEIHKSRMWGTYPDIHVVRQVKKFRSQWKGDDWPWALDIGCGVGAHACMLEREQFDVVAIDASQTAISRMIERSAFFGSAFVHDIASEEGPMQYSKSTGYDFILDNFTLTYLEHPPWERILSWLKPGGWMIHASFETAPKGTPMAWEHKEPGHVVERHSSWVEGNAFSFVVRKYVKPCA